MIPAMCYFDAASRKRRVQKDDRGIWDTIRNHFPITRQGCDREAGFCVACKWVLKWQSLKSVKSNRCRLECNLQARFFYPTGDPDICEVDHISPKFYGSTVPGRGTYCSGALSR